MTRTYLPFALATLLIGALTFVEGYYLKDRWGSLAAEAGELGQRFAQVPKEIGAWTGVDLPVEDIVKKTAGAVNYVSRRYTNDDTGQEVRLWLIVGHSRDIVRHTPSVCYPASGFRQDGPLLRHHIDVEGGNQAVFFTAKFIKEDELSRRIERVFWAWNHPDNQAWEAPEDSHGKEDPRFHYGLARALYKIYFTSDVGSQETTVEENAAVEFARLMLPAIDQALFPADAVDPIATEDVPPATG